jgi:lipopolysaccharide/colanic/teichoic acid biosynthesis glycosyltransferase
MVMEDARYAYRFRVKAGITGNAQVYGNKEGSQMDLLKLDLIYIQHYSIMLDVKLLMTSLRR